MSHVKIYLDYHGAQPIPILLRHSALKQGWGWPNFQFIRSSAHRFSSHFDST